MIQIEEKEIVKGIDEAYKKAGSNAYFGNGFRAGADFALKRVKNLTSVMPSVVYLVTNEDKMTVESAHWKIEDAKKEVDDWAKRGPRFQFMVVELAIH